MPPSNIYLIAKPSFIRSFDLSYLLPFSIILFSSLKSTPEHILIVHCFSIVFVKKDPSGRAFVSFLPSAVVIVMRGFPNRPPPPSLT